MLKTIPILLLPLLVSCSYGSMYEAKQACDKWKADGGKYTQQGETYSTKCHKWITLYNSDLGTICADEEVVTTPTSYELDLRGCKYEPETNQFLGWQIVDASPGQVLTIDQKTNSKISKHFRF